MFLDIPENLIVGHEDKKRELMSLDKFAISKCKIIIN